MEFFQVDDGGRLFVSAVIEDWNAVAPYDIDVVIDLEGGLDLCIPTDPNHLLYVYFPFNDDDQELPDMGKLGAIARLAAALIERGHRVLAHCSMGLNRSGLVAGLILTSLGMPGPAALARIRERRPGALYNQRFADFLASIGGAPANT